MTIDLQDAAPELASQRTQPAAPPKSARLRHGTQDDEAAYVLHAYPFKETSLVIEVFSRNFGRLGLVARGARRPRSALRGMLMAFQPLSLSWAGKSELRTLHRAEGLAGHAQLGGMSLLCGFYLNELLLKLMQREDAHEHLYDAYDNALSALRTQDGHARTLRRFEKLLLRELGYGLLLDRDAQGDAIRSDARYTYLLEAGPALQPEPSSSGRIDVMGRTLLDMAIDDYRLASTMQESRALMRYILNHYLGGQVLHTRQLLLEMQQI